MFLWCWGSFLNVGKDTFLKLTTSYRGVKLVGSTELIGSEQIVKLHTSSHKYYRDAPIQSFQPNYPICITLKMSSRITRSFLNWKGSSEGLVLGLAKSPNDDVNSCWWVWEHV